MNCRAVVDPATSPEDRFEMQRTGNGMTEICVTRREVSTGLAWAAALEMVRVCAAGEQIFPARPVRFILPFAAAGVADITARVAAEKLGDRLGQRFVVENQPGPGGIAAARAAL